MLVVDVVTVVLVGLVVVVVVVVGPNIPKEIVCKGSMQR